MAEINRSNKNCDAAMNYGVMGKVTNNYEMLHIWTFNNVGKAFLRSADVTIEKKSWTWTCWSRIHIRKKMLWDNTII